MKHKDIISQLTNREKADLLTGKDFWSTLNIDRLGIPFATLCDGPHGVRRQEADSDHLGLNDSIPATCFPTASAMANSWNEALGQEMGTALGEEARAQEVNVLLGPGINMKRNPLCGRNFEYFSEDPYLAGKMAASYIRGIQSNGISACVKHFACNNQEFRRMIVDSVVDERTLREIYLTAFEIAVKEGHAKSLMSSYNKVNGTYANENQHLLMDILRKEWGFDGVVVTDWGGCNDRVEGLKAGNELDMPGNKRGADAVFEALESGKISSDLVDDCLDRLIDLLLETDRSVRSHSRTFDADAHHALAEKCAEECIVLLKNSNDVLPLADEKVSFIGSFAGTPRFQGAGSSIVNPTRTINIIDEVHKYPLNFIGYAEGFERFGKKNDRLRTEAVELAGESDTIVFFAGLDEIREAEGIDRPDMKLPANQLELLKEILALKKKTVVALFSGSSVEMDVIEDADAIVHMYLSGQGSSSALLRVLCGQVNPSGKLAESYPFRYEDCSTAKLFHSGDFAIEYREGPFIGYRYYQTADVPVRYPFGFGLSYTTFAYSNLETDPCGVSFTITNTGSREGAETAQLYISKKDSTLIRPAKELKGFKKVFLKSGESAAVRIDFNDYTFRFFDTAAGCWKTEAGTYEISVGASSEDIRLSAVLTKEGDTVPSNIDDNLLRYYQADVKNISREDFEHLLGRKVPSQEYTRDKDGKHIQIGDNQTVSDLKYAKGWTGRLFAGGIHLAHTFLVKTGKKTTANTLEMGMFHQPMRALAQFGSMNQTQYEGMLQMFNGHTWKGLRQFLKKS